MSEWMGGIGPKLDIKSNPNDDDYALEDRIVKHVNDGMKDIFKKIGMSNIEGIIPGLIMRPGDDHDVAHMIAEYREKLEAK